MKGDLELSDKQQEIIEAALKLLGEKGYNDLSLRDIAKKINVKAPAIYWHFQNKAMLMDYMAEYILRKGMGDFSPRKNEQAWQDWLICHISLLRKAMLSYPDGGRVVAGAHLIPAITLAKLMEYSLASLCSAGIGLRTAQCIVLTTIHYTFGFVIEEQADKLDQKKQPKYAITGININNLMEIRNAGGTYNQNFLSGLELIIFGRSGIEPQKKRSVKIKESKAH